MPSTKGLEILMAKKQLTDADWINLIEARRKMFSSYFNKFTFGTFGSLKCLKGGTEPHELKLDDPRLCYGVECPCSFDTQGIFGVEPYENIKRIEGTGFKSCEGWSVLDGTMHIWGLTRDNKWIMATVGFVGVSGYNDYGKEKATTVIVAECDLPRILQITTEKPYRIWNKLGESIKKFAEDRKRLYDEALGLAQMIEIEELTFRLVSSKEY